MAEQERGRVLYLVIPCYNEEEVLPETSKRLTAKLGAMIEMGLISQDSKIVFVNDGSKDHTWQLIRQYHEENPMIQGINLSRNKGHQSALLAGLMTVKEYCDMAISMDADLQDPPSLLPEMYRLITEEGFDCVGSRRVDRKGEPPIRSFFARLFYRMINRMSKTDVVDGARDFQMMRRKVVDAILSMPEKNRFSKGIFGWVGFKKKWLEYENVERVAGETKWSFWKLLVYALDGILAFTTVPLVFSSLLGILFCLIALIMILFIIVRTIAFGDPTSGWPSLACIIIFVSGVQLFCIGILGQYLAKTYIETKNRPIFLIGETNIEEDMTKEAKENEQ